MKASKILINCVLFVGLINTLAQGTTSPPLFCDNFNGATLDASKWTVFVDALGQYNEPYVSDGLLYSQGYHTRIDSIETFAPTEQSVTASAYIRLAGDYHKFGFAPNPHERATPINGYFFDTLDDGVGGETNYVWAIARSAIDSESINPLMEVKIPVTWDEFHEFSIERTLSEVIYSIDGHEVARVSDAYTEALPVGVWNDRWDMMQTDWVCVTPEPATISMLGLGSLVFLRRRRML